MKLAVLGHVEWIEFIRVGQVPTPGEIITAREVWAEPAGGGGVAAVELARLSGHARLFTALGNDALGRRACEELRGLGVSVDATFRPEPQRRGFTYLDDSGERTITVIEKKQHPSRSDELAWDEFGHIDAVYVCAGTPDAIQAARQARIVVATARELEMLKKAHVELDALVASVNDPSEQFSDGGLDPHPRLVVRTAGAEGGTYEPGGGRWTPTPLPGPFCDAYGAGDSFAAGLTYALAASRSVEDAVEFAASRGAEALARPGAHGVHSPSAPG